MTIRARMEEIKKEYENTQKDFSETNSKLQQLQNKLIYLEGAFAELKRIDDEDKVKVTDTNCNRNE